MNLGFLRPLYDEIGDYVSVYLDTDRAHEDALRAIDLRWRAARQRLADAGASQASLDAAAAVSGGPSAGPGLRGVRAGRCPRLRRPLDAPPRREIARLAPLPHLMPLLAQRRPPIPHVRVSATRMGGEIVAIGGSGQRLAGLGRWPAVAGAQDCGRRLVAGPVPAERRGDLGRERQGAGRGGDRGGGPDRRPSTSS